MAHALPKTASESVDYDPFADSPIEKSVPTTEAQREVWLADLMGREASLAYNECASFHIDGPLNAEAFTTAVAQLTLRHEALRSTLGVDGMDLIVQMGHGLPLTRHDWRGASDQEQRLAAFLQSEVDTPFDLLQGPLVRATLLQTGDQRHRMVLTAHHIVCDGWSLGVIARDLGALYNAALLGIDLGTALAEPTQYASYSLAQAHAHAADGDAHYWRQQFTTLPEALDLPSDRPRPSVRRYHSRREDGWIDAETLTELKRFSGRQGASLFGTLLAGFASLLSRLSGQRDLVVGVPAAGQLAYDMRDLVGHCVNLLPVRLDVSAGHSVSERVMHCQRQMLDAFEHQRYTFGTLLKQLPIVRDPSRPALVSVMFNVDQALDSRTLAYEGLDVAVTNNPRTHENFELFLNISQMPDGLKLECQYNSSLFDAATVHGWLQAFPKLLKSWMQTSDAPADAAELVPVDQAEQLAQWNDKEQPYDSLQTLSGLLSAQAKRSPDACAVVQPGVGSLRYAELHARAWRIAHYLRARGIGRGQLVGLCLQRGLDMLAAQLAVLHAGAAYVPLDPAYPEDRLAYMASDSGIALLISESSLLQSLPWPRQSSLLLDIDTAALASLPESPLPPSSLDAQPVDPAYVIYTSGSTGKPKGVVVQHQAVVNFLASMAREPGMSAADTVLAVTTLSFDIAVLELLLPLSVGAQIVLASREQALDGSALLDLIDTHRVTLLQATPSSWRMLIESGWQGTPGLRALIGGEGLPSDLAKALLARTAELWNMYGPTETTVWSTCWRVLPDVPISIGQPINNTVVRVLDERQRLCPIGVPGEIYIGGDGVTLGYLHRPELTAERFVPDPWAPGQRLYRTGDRGRWRHDGLLEHLGRLDFQVKVRGHRIELGEIEAAIGSHPCAARCLVIVREDTPGDQRLVAYVVPQVPHSVDAQALREHLRASLPEYMLPQHVVSLDSIPLLPNGKVNRHALPLPTHEPAVRATRQPPSTSTEVAIAEIWRRMLGLDNVDLRDNFFDMGGHSLLAMRAVTEINNVPGMNITLRQLIFESLGQIASAVEIAPGAAPPSPTTNSTMPSNASKPGEPGLLGRLFGRRHSS